MRINLTKKDLVNTVYMQIGFSKQISENLIEEFFSLIVLTLKKKRSVKTVIVTVIAKQSFIFIIMMVMFVFVMPVLVKNYATI